MKVFEVYPGLPGEDRYRRLIEENGKPVPTDKLAKQDRERKKEVETYARQVATPASREKARGRWKSRRRRYSAADGRYVPDVRYPDDTPRTDRRSRHDLRHAHAEAV